jgi:hypothetical protein
VKAGGSVQVSWYITLAGTGEGKHTHQIKTSLDLQKIGSTGGFKRIERHTVGVTEGIGYKQKVGDNFLLVTNATTTPHELNAWKALARELGLSFAVWDLSVHEHLSLSKPVSAKSNSTLLKDWREKTIVILNKSNSIPGYGPLMPFDRLSSRDLDQALREYNTKLYVLGAPYPTDLRPSIAPPNPTRRTDTFESADDVIRRYKNELPEVGTEVRLKIRTWSHLMSPAESVIFDRELDAITRHFNHRFPHALITISQHYEPELIKKIPLSGVKHLSLGEIVIKRQNIAVDGTILSGEVDSATISATSTIASLNNKVLLLAAMPTTALATKAVDTLIKG